MGISSFYPLAGRLGQVTGRRQEIKPSPSTMPYATYPARHLKYAELVQHAEYYRELIPLLSRLPSSASVRSHSHVLHPDALRHSRPQAASQYIYVYQSSRTSTILHTSVKVSQLFPHTPQWFTNGG